MTYSPSTITINNIRAETASPRLLVEVYIIMDVNETLCEIHDVAEELRMKLESLPDVERAYVHFDFETTQKPKQFLKKTL